MVGEAVQSHFQDFPVTMSNPNATALDRDEFMIAKKVEYAVTLSAMVGMFQVSIKILFAIILNEKIFSVLN